MPKCSSSKTTSGAIRHMYSIASWSPSQSEPLIVSYMCQSQLSSLMLPSDAPIPPCAATVCERVGNTLDSTATDNPASASCSDARIPAPPAPTTIASNLRTGNVIGYLRAARSGIRARGGPSRSSGAPPQDQQHPSDVRHEHDDREHLQRQAQSSRLDVVHPDVAHADPGVPQTRQRKEQSGNAE